MPDSVRPHPGGTFELGGRTVARIGFGAMQLTPHGRAPVTREDALAVLHRARELGVDHIDTAQFYGDGAANGFIRDAFGDAQHELLIATKVGAVVGGEAGLIPGQKPEQLRAQVEANLRALGTDHIGLVNLRRVDAPPGIVATGDQIVDLDSQLAELIAMRDEGLIGAIGLSAVTEPQIRVALPAGIAGVQNLYGMLERDGEPALALCREHGIAWVPFFPLGSAFPGRPQVREDPVAGEIAAELGVTAAQVGLAWLLAHAPNALLIPGTGRLAHLEQNVAVGEVQLSAEMIARLDTRAAA